MSSSYFYVKFKLFAIISLFLNIVTAQATFYESKKRVDISKISRELWKQLKPASTSATCSPRCTNSHRMTGSICGTDGKWYVNQCHVIIAGVCEKRHLNTIKETACMKNKNVECREMYDLLISRYGAVFVDNFFPQCTKKGKYKRFQCIDNPRGNAVCFCIDRNTGQLLREQVTSKDECSSVHNRRRRHSERSVQHNGCTPAKKRSFAKQMLRQTVIEYERYLKLHLQKRSGKNVSDQGSSFVNSSFGDKPEHLKGVHRQAVEWHFLSQDLKERDGRLDGDELRQFLQFSVDITNNSPCKRTFRQYCDTNRNGYLERAEWSACLGVPTKADQDVVPHSENYNNRRRQAHVSHIDTLRKNGKRKAKHRPLACNVKRQRYLKKRARNPNSHLLVPECTPEGNYRRMQCFISESSVELCMCQDPINGKPSSTTNGSCINTSFSSVCPISVRKEFIMALLRLYQEEFRALATLNTNARYVNNATSFAQRLWRLKFDMHDTNKNSQLDRREFKRWRRETRHHFERGINKKCARKFVRHCDVDKNRIINLHEMDKCFAEVNFADSNSSI